jgi:invasion protein IalB
VERVPDPRDEEQPLTFATGTLRRSARIAVGIVGILTGIVAAAAQQAPQNPALKQFGPRINPGAQQQRLANLPKPETIATHGAWKIECDTTPATKDPNAAKERACGMVQTAADAKRPGIGLTLVLRKNKQNDKVVPMMQVIAPLGVYLPLGVALEIDGEAVGRVPFTRCSSQLCIAVGEASAPTLEKMRKGAIAKFIIYENPGVGVPLEFSLKGFTAAFDGLDNL